MFKQKFLGGANILVILLSLSSTALIGCGMTVLLASGCMDLSVGSMAALAGVVTCQLFHGGAVVPVPVAFLIGLAVGVVGGFLNGLVVTRWNISPFIVTLGTMNVFRGITQLLSQGVGVTGLPQSFLNFGQGTFLGIQYPIFVCVIAVIIFDILLRRHRFFRQSYFVGGNEKAALVTGIKVNRVKLINFVIVGGLAALVGVTLASRFGSASSSIGQGMEMQVITACVIGGASLSGGEGTVLGAFLGALLLSMITSALNMFGVDVYWQNVLTGLILIFTVVLDTILKTKRETMVRVDIAKKRLDKASA
jgi:ribose transport system permease protein